MATDSDSAAWAQRITSGIARGDRRALAEFYEVWFDRCHAMARSLTRRDESFCLDIVQETMLKAYRGAARFQGGASVSTWLFRILLNTCYDFLRQSRRRPESPLPADDLAGSSAAARNIDPSLRLSIEKALSRLDPRARTAFWLCEVEGFSHREAGEILEVGEGASRALLFRARRQLQKALAGGAA